MCINLCMDCMTSLTLVVIPSTNEATHALTSKKRMLLFLMLVSYTITTLLTYRYTHHDYLVIAGDAGFVDDDGKKHAENGNDHDALLQHKHALLTCAAFCLQFSLCSSLVLLPVVRCDAATLATCPSPLHLLLLLSVVNAAAVANAAAASTATPSTPWP